MLKSFGQENQDTRILEKSLSIEIFLRVSCCFLKESEISQGCRWQLWLYKRNVNLIMSCLSIFQVKDLTRGTLTGKFPLVVCQNLVYLCLFRVWLKPLDVCWMLNVSSWQAPKNYKSWHQENGCLSKSWFQLLGRKASARAMLRKLAWQLKKFLPLILMN